MVEFEEYDEDVWDEAGISTDEMAEEIRILTAERDHLAEDKRELMDALEWIKGASDVATNRCSCGRPTGVLALHHHAKTALDKIKAREVE